MEGLNVEILHYLRLGPFDVFRIIQNNMHYTREDYKMYMWKTWIYGGSVEVIY
jgi:hypothetical protein